MTSHADDANPPTRVDNVIIWPGGFYRKMIWLERFEWRLGRREYER